MMTQNQNVSSFLTTNSKQKEQINPEMAIKEVMDGVNYNEKIINMEKLTEHFQFTTKNK